MTTKISGNAGLNLIRNYDLVWMAKPIGEPFPLRDDIAGIPIPPTDNAAYRFIKLTAGDSYNDGALANESVTGTAPLIVATADILLPESPISGTTWHLINTERRMLRPGNSGGLQNPALMSHVHKTPIGYDGGTVAYTWNGSDSNPAFGSEVQTGAKAQNFTIGAAADGRTIRIAYTSVQNSNVSGDNVVYNQGVTYYMRIL